jgi:PAS domain S-box-containing protein
VKLVFLQAITYSGIKEDDPPSKKRGIILSNFVALTLVAANILIFLIIPGNHNIFGFLEMLFAVTVFSFPILLNRWHFTTFSRLYECYLPSIIIFWYMTNVMRQTDVVPISFYDGLRFYLLAASCIPYLIFERKNSILLIAGILPNFIAIIFCDPLLEIFGVGYEQNGIVDAGYEFTSVRVFIAYVIINGICLALKFIVDDSDTLNARLISELAEKNELIREQSEEQIRHSENKYKSLFEQASDAIVIADLNGNFTDCNPRMCQLLGYTREELIGMNITQFLDEAQLEEHPVRLDLLAKGELRFNERRMKRKDGSIVEIENSVQKMSDNRLLGILRDVTPRKKIEQELREAEAKFRNLVEQSLVGVYIMVDEKYVYVNPRFAEIFGYAQNELIDVNSIETVIHPDDRELVIENVRRRASGEKESVHYEVKGIRKDGTTIWAEIYGTRTQYSGKLAIIGTLIDISDRKKLEEQQALFVSMVNSSEDAIISKTLDGNITTWNRGAVKLFGYEADEVLGKHISILIPESRLKEEDYILQMIRDGKAVENFETQRMRKNGELIYVSLTASPVRDATGKIVGASRIGRDITARKQAEAEKERTTFLLNERVKERRTLYDARQALRDDHPINEALQEIVDIMPKGWQYPEVSAARIIYGDLEFRTMNFNESRFSQNACFETPDGLPVMLELVYLEDKPHEFEGPFLAEERDLINMLAEMIRIYLTRKQEADALRKSEANLNATINNTTFFIWSINRKYELKNINKPFWNYIRHRYGIEVQEGQSIIDIYRDGAQLEEFSSAWLGHYRKAMEGESFVLEEEYSGRYFKSSLNPIIENAMVAGVTVFSEETTEHKKREKELSEANKQIDDLKLMALRAAMNPHFIFNTLNSIQYYIMENDQRNAVNYLSTFSKLIRSILNHSVVSKVKLNEELEMLRHYITLEQMRFENKFDFTFDVDSAIDTANIEIPSMLIQPFVENAILHGINNKPGRGTLKISVKGSSDSILFEVEDDGVGRGATQKLHQQKLSEHKSHGTALTQERLRLINTRRNVSLEIVDLDKNGSPAGTKVKIWIAN